MPTPAAPTPNELISALADKVAALKRLLLEEQQAVAEKREAELQPLLAEKTRLLQDVGALEEQRRQALGDAGWGDDKAGMQEWLQSQPDGRNLLAGWTSLLADLRECQLINEANGSIVRQSLEQNEQLLHILRGTSPEEDSGYGPQGQPPSGASSRDLGKA